MTALLVFNSNIGLALQEACNRDLYDETKLLSKAASRTQSTLKKFPMEKYIPVDIYLFFLLVNIILGVQISKLSVAI